jgi:hypothetical protein
LRNAEINDAIVKDTTKTGGLPAIGIPTINGLITNKLEVIGTINKEGISYKTLVEA